MNNATYKIQLKIFMLNFTFYIKCNCVFYLNYEIVFQKKSFKLPHKFCFFSKIFNARNGYNKLLCHKKQSSVKIFFKKWLDCKQLKNFHWSKELKFTNLDRMQNNSEKGTRDPNTSSIR